MTAAKRHPGEGTRLTRERILDAAERRALELGISRVRVGHVAADAGVSRQTVYNEFGDKWGVARALAMRVAERLLDEVEAQMATCAGPAEAVADVMAYCLKLAEHQPLIQLSLSREKGDDMLALVTTDLGDVIALAKRRIAAAALRLWPGELERTQIDLGVEILVRVAISHIVCPTESVEQASLKAAEVVRGFLGETEPTS